MRSRKDDDHQKAYIVASERISEEWGLSSWGIRILYFSDGKDRYIIYKSIKTYKKIFIKTSPIAMVQKIFSLIYEDMDTPNRTEIFNEIKNKRFHLPFSNRIVRWHFLWDNYQGVIHEIKKQNR